MRPDDRCPCGGGRFADCCEPILDGTRVAGTAEELMRSRYTAYALGNADHVFRTWHPRTRPDDPKLDADVVWTGLRILRTEAGGVDDGTGSWSSSRATRVPWVAGSCTK